MHPAVSVHPGNPFPGLRPFRADEEHLFFGRESQVDTMIDKLAATHFLAVVGTSGSGKSSLVNCGLRPALHRGLMAKAGTSWRIAQLRPGSSPIRAMARALAEDGVLFGGFDAGGLTLEEIVDANLRMSKLGLVDVCQQARLAEGVNLLVVVDQFEELFRYRALAGPGSTQGLDRNPEGTAFVNLLLEAKAQSACPIYIVLTMRSDFLGDCAEFPGLPEAINEGQYLVPRLTREERRAAISGPVGVGGGEISPVLLTRLVNDVGDNPDQLSLLQHALNRTWARWQHEGRGEGSLELEHYEAIGTMAAALDQHAEKAYHELTGERPRNLCEKIFKALTDKGTDARGIRRPQSVEKLMALTGAGQAELAEVINVFRKPSRSFLMPPLAEALKPDTVADISHESLMRVWKRLKGWANEEAQSAQLYRRLTETTALHAAGKAGLWHDPDLQVALEWRDREQPTEAWAGLYGGGFESAIDFLARSERQRDQEVREKQEAQKRELLQAQTLADERQRRVEEQAAATRKLQRWLAALAVVAVMLIGAVVFAVQAGRRAGQQAQIAVARAQDAERAKTLAEFQKAAAEKADNEMRLEALRVRSANLEDQSAIAGMADMLIQYSSSPQQAAQWHYYKGYSLIQQGDYEAAQSELSAALATVPDNPEFRTARGYLAMLRDRSRDALTDFEYIRDHIDSKAAVNYVNLAIAYADLDNSPAAHNSLQKAILNTRNGGFPGSREDYVLPDITTATGRTTLLNGEEGFEAALYFMKANLEAAEGNTSEFQKALKEADEKSLALSSLVKEDAYFTAMSWAWINLRVVCPESGAACRDYGALVGQAQLWERAGYPDWAGCYYQKFQKQQARWADKRYISLAKWAADAQAKLPVSSFSCPSPRAPDVPALEMEANEALARKDFSRAIDLLDTALHKAGEPDQIHLLIAKSNALMQAGWGEDAKRRLEANEAAAQEHQKKAAEAFRTVIRNSDLILKKDPDRAPAGYLYRAMAQDWLDPSQQSVDLAVKDINRALKLEPAYTDALRWLDMLAPDGASNSDPRQTLAYLERYRDSLNLYYRMAAFDPKPFLHHAKLANSQKQYADAWQSIETAIHMQPQDLSLYEIREEAERGLGISESQAKRNLAEGYRQAGDLLKRRGNLGAANNAYQMSWSVLAALAKNPSDEEVRCDANLTTCTATRTVPGNGELVYNGILSIGETGGAVREARIDKGSKDGVVVGVQGAVWSLASKEADGHERARMQRGSAEVLSVEPDSALVRITMVSPTGDGLVRESDVLTLMARTPPHPKDSQVWPLVRFNAVLEDVKNEKIADYRSLYSSDTPEVENKLHQVMLRDLHDAGPLYGDRLNQSVLDGKPITKGKFQGKTVRQAFEAATPEDLDESLKYIAQYPGDLFGKRLKPANIFLYWIIAGTPTN